MVYFSSVHSLQVTLWLPVANPSQAQPHPPLLFVSGNSSLTGMSLEIEMVIWMDRALFGDESLIPRFLDLSVASWFLLLNFTFFKGVSKKLPLCILL
jgi:hypothetical protein